MPSESGQDQPAGPAAAPGLSRAGQVAVITGGSAGPGLAIAATLARAGTTVVLASRSADGAPQQPPGCLPGPGRPCTAGPATSPVNAPPAP